MLPSRIYLLRLHCTWIQYYGSLSYTTNPEKKPKPRTRGHFLALTCNPIGASHKRFHKIDLIDPGWCGMPRYLSAPKIQLSGYNSFSEKRGAYWLCRQFLAASPLRRCWQNANHLSQTKSSMVQDSSDHALKFDWLSVTAKFTIFISLTGV